MRRAFVVTTVLILLVTLMLPADCLAANDDTTGIPPSLAENLSPSGNISISNQVLRFSLTETDVITVQTEASFSLGNLETAAVDGAVAIPLSVSLNEIKDIALSASIDGVISTPTIAFADIYKEPNTAFTCFKLDDTVTTYTYTVSSDSEMYISLEMYYEPMYSSVIINGIDDIIYLPNNRYRLGVKCNGEQSFSISFIGAEPFIKTVGFTDSKMLKQTESYDIFVSEETKEVSQWLQEYSADIEHIDVEQSVLFLANELDLMFSAESRRFLTWDAVEELRDQKRLFYIIVNPLLLPKETHNITVSYASELRTYDTNGTVDPLFLIDYTFSENTLWHSDCQLHIDIDTDMHIVSSSVYLKQSEDGKYFADIDFRQHHNKTLDIVLCQEEKPQTKSPEILSSIMNVLYIIVPALFVIVAALILIAFAIGRLKRNGK